MSRLGFWLWLPANLLQGLFTLLWSALWISVALGVHLVARRREPALWLARRVWGPGLVYGALARLEVSGRERIDFARPHFFVANHQSWIDIPALFMAVPAPLHFLAKRELEPVPFLGRYIRAMGMIFVDRADRRGATATVTRARDLLRQGGHVASFPEGTRSRNGRLKPFKSGAFGAALDAGVDVVPVAIRGAGRVLPAGGFKVRPGCIEVRFGTPIPTADLAHGDRARLARRAADEIAALLARPA